jgi:hypothetical protein
LAPQPAIPISPLTKIAAAETFTKEFTFIYVTSFQ